MKVVTCNSFTAVLVGAMETSKRLVSYMRSRLDIANLKDANGVPVRDGDVVLTPDTESKLLNTTVKQDGSLQLNYVTPTRDTVTQEVSAADLGLDRYVNNVVNQKLASTAVKDYMTTKGATLKDGDVVLTPGDLTEMRDVELTGDVIKFTYGSPNKGNETKAYSFNLAQNIQTHQDAYRSALGIVELVDADGRPITNTSEIYTTRSLPHIVTDVRVCDTGGDVYMNTICIEFANDVVTRIKIPAAMHIGFASFTGHSVAIDDSSSSVHYYTEIIKREEFLVHASFLDLAKQDTVTHIGFSKIETNAPEICRLIDYTYNELEEQFEIRWVIETNNTPTAIEFNYEVSFRYIPKMETE